MESSETHWINPTIISEWRTRQTVEDRKSGPTLAIRQADAMRNSELGRACAGCKRRSGHVVCRFVRACGGWWRERNTIVGEGRTDVRSPSAAGLVAGDVQPDCFLTLQTGDPSPWGRSFRVRLPFWMPARGCSALRFFSQQLMNAFRRGVTVSAWK